MRPLLDVFAPRAQGKFSAPVLVTLPVKLLCLREIGHSFCLRRNGTLDVVLVLVGAIQIFEEVFFSRKAYKTKVSLLDK